VRPALLTAWLGYLFVSIGLLVDLGRYYSIWHPMIYWQGNSVLFEVGICVMTYLTVLTIEFLPVVLEGIRYHLDPKNALASFLESMQKPAEILQQKLERVMPAFILAGVVLSCMHQSSLGALLLIAPSKLNPLWFTPMLPLLFLMSAIMVGFPMVIFESLIASRSFQRKPEMEVLLTLSRSVSYLIGIYLLLKIGDLMVRRPYSSFRFDVDTVSFLVEIIIGCVVPLAILVTPRLYKTTTGLFVASSMVVFGVVLNRINVYLVGYNPPYAKGNYFPSIGEIAVTAGLISSILFCYRLLVTLFPVLPEDRGDPSESAEAIQDSEQRAGDSTRLIKNIVVFTLFLSYSSAFPLTVFSEPEAKMDKMPSYLLLDFSSLNQEEDLYHAVRFMHKKHASLEQGDCTVCHHRAPESENDRVGRPIFRSDIEQTGMKACRVCHSSPAQPDAITRPGLKGALHQRCIDCHAERDSGPQTCTSCHRRRVADHQDFIQLSDEAAPQDVTAQCLTCHPEAGESILQSAHWNWAGLSPDTRGYENRNDLGKKVLINNYCIHVDSNMERCSMCHIGYGWKDDTFDFSDSSNIDCLVCHDASGMYKKSPTDSGYPAKDVDLIAAAQTIGHPNRDHCGFCHFYGGGGDGVKHGDLDSSLSQPSAALDVHMGKYNFTCQDCHITENHQIAGACKAIPAREGRVSCEDCHTSSPHNGSSLLNHHLNEHGKAVACQTCHIPQFARGNPTKMKWDWSVAGLDLPEEVDEYGKPRFLKSKGSFVWGKNVTPSYVWDNGKDERHLVGDSISPDSETILNRPLGDIHDPKARIAPYKVHHATQISDAVYKYLIVPNLWKGYWRHFDWDQASRDGMKSVGLEYSGKYEFVPTVMYWKINHQVAPKEMALSCYQCHEPSNTCLSCHDSLANDEKIRIGALDRKLHIRALQSIDFPFEDLGYQGDPIQHGSRFKKF
ncbi:MAG: tetrathionate reductase family octaheme c-type cytochrome, partial [Candidatus Hinthialibacter sp.]